jgi:glycosyltransferase involved in cell wall biosynthesis
VLEFVENGKTGLVTRPEPQAIGGSITRLMADSQEAARLGSAGKARVSNLTWDSVVDSLLDAAS